MVDTASSVHAVELLMLTLMVAVAVVSGIARRLSISYPIVLVLTGLASSFLPGIPRVELSPDIVFLAFLPPLLFAAAWQTSWREFRNNIIPIGLLAFGLVFFTAVGVAFTARLFLPSFDWRLGFLLGAVVSPTDAVAASAMAKRVGMPQRIVDILEGESLVNDATGLLALEFGVDMIVHGTTPSLAGGTIRLLWLVVGGSAVGLLLGSVVAWFERWINDGPVEIAVTLIVPYIAYLTGERMHASGVIAVVTCGLLMSRGSASFFSPESRLQALAVWDALEFLLNGLVFILIGLQLPYVMSGLHDISRWKLLAYGTTFSAVLIGLRLIWMYPSSLVANRLRWVLQHQHDEVPDARSLFVTGWSGMRGVVAIAAASSLPYTLANGQPFHQRNLIVFLTFSVILFTLVVQGIALPYLVRFLGLNSEEDAFSCSEGEARRIIIETAIHFLERGRTRHPEDDHTYEDLLHQYQHRLEEVVDCGPGTTPGRSSERGLVDVLRDTVRVERGALNKLRDEGRIGDGLHRTIERELDLNESRLTSMF